MCRVYVWKTRSISSPKCRNFYDSMTCYTLNRKKIFRANLKPTSSKKTKQIEQNIVLGDIISVIIGYFKTAIRYRNNYLDNSTNKNQNIFHMLNIILVL